MIFPTQKSFFFSGQPAKQQSTPQKKKSQQIPAIAALQFQKNDFPDPKIIFFRAVCQVAVDNANKEKSQQIPAIASETWFSRPKNHFLPGHRKRRNPGKSQQSPLSNFTEWFPRPKAVCQAAIDNAKKEKSQQITNRHSPISQKWFSRPKNHFFAGQLAKQQ